MQNVDFYTGRSIRPVQQYDREDPEYFSRISNFQSKDEHKRFKRASRILSLIVALIIISFTAGLVRGIKFTSGKDVELVDPQTKEAVNGIGKKVATLINNNDADSGSGIKTSFPKSEYPYVIRLGRQFTKEKSLNIAKFLSDRGHTVILSKEKVYVGPYKDYNLAVIAQKEIVSYAMNEDAEIIKR